MMIDLKAKPFALSQEQINWVEQTLAGMTLAEKIGQLFCITGMMTQPEELEKVIRTYHPGGFMYRAGKAEEIRAAQAYMQKVSKIPMLLSCNLESGGNGVAHEGTFFGKELQVAATGETQQAYRLGRVCALEGAAAGCNWAFAPIVDIDYNWQNPITNVRTFGNDPETVLAQSSAYLDGVKESGADMAVCIKHFPGDGVDFRDQHLLSSVNSLPVDAWMETYGRIYKELIAQGAQTVMVGHILQPALTRLINPSIKDEDILPGSTSKELMTGVLREMLGFNGLISTDATPMVGFTGSLTRRSAIAHALMGGADVILFCKNIEEDFAGVRADIEDGTITMERVNEAVMRQLALKAALHLPQKQVQGTLVPQPEGLSVIGCAQHVAWARECADKAITLVKDNQNLLPLSPAKTKRVRLTVLGEGQKGAFGDNDAVGALFCKKLQAEGFAVSLYDEATLEHGEIFESGIAQMREKFDVSIVLANVATGSNNTTRRVDWIPLMAANEPWYTREIPTLFISFCNPHHMADVPFISTFINCYTNNTYCVEAAVEKLVGKSAFQGKNPTDVWCDDIWGGKFL